MNAAFCLALEEGDFRALRRLHSAAMPHLPTPKSDAESELTMHVARTAAASVSFKARAYSHRWLIERDMPSQLPDELKPSAERMYPVVVESVGIALKTHNPILQPVIGAARKAMEDAVEEAYADKRTDPAHLTQRMNEAKERTYRTLLGIRGE